MKSPPVSSLSPCRSTNSGRWTSPVRTYPPSVGFGALTAFDVAAGGAAELHYETPSARHAALFGQALLWVAALVAASRLRRPAWTSSADRSRRPRPVIELADDVELPTDAGDVPVMVPREPVGAVSAASDGVQRRPARPTTSTPAAVPRRRSRRRAAWVDDMFADEDDSGPERRGAVGHELCAGLPMLVVTIAALVAIVLGAGTAVVPTSAVFSTVSAPWMPAAPLPGGLTSAWFCPGVPAAGRGGPHRERHRVQLRRDRAARPPHRAPRRRRAVTRDIDVPPSTRWRSASTSRRVPVRRGIRRGRRRRRPRRTTRRRSRRASLSRPVPTPAPPSGTSPRGTRSTAVSSSSCCPTPTTTRRSSTSRWRPSGESESPSATRASPCRRSRCVCIDVNSIIGDQTRDRRQRGRHPRSGGRRSLATCSTRPTAPATSMTLGRAGRPRPVVVRVRRAGRQRRRELLPLQPGRGGRRGDSRAARVPAARRDGAARHDRRARRRGRRVPHGRRRRASRPTAQRRVRHRTDDSGGRRAGADPHDRHGGRRRRSRSGRRHGPTATSPTRGTSGSARRSPRRRLSRCTTTRRRSPS